MEKPTCFLDLDRTIYHTDKLTADAATYLRTLGHSDTAIASTRAAAQRDGYTFDRHLWLLGHTDHRHLQYASILGDLLDRGDRYLFQGAVEALRTLSDHALCKLLTFGHPTHQRRKFRGIHSLSDVFTSQYYVWTRHTKGDIIHDRGPHAKTWAVDDEPGQLEDIRRKAPWARCIRMRSREVTTTAHRGDGTSWLVVGSIPEVVEVILNAN